MRIIGRFQDLNGQLSRILGSKKEKKRKVLVQGCEFKRDRFLKILNDNSIYKSRYS